MMNRTAAFTLIVFTGCVAAACETRKSANPLSPDVAGPIPGVAITAPKPLEPLMGQQVVADGTPTTLLIENSGTSGQRELFLQVDVAADAGFQQFLHQANRVTPGPNGRTSYRLPEPLGPGHTYYWRARALDGANTGPVLRDFPFRDGGAGPDRDSDADGAAWQYLHQPAELRRQKREDYRAPLEMWSTASRLARLPARRPRPWLRCRLDPTARPR